MQYFDTHVHLDRAAAEGTIPDIMERASAAGVSRIMAVGGNHDGNRIAMEAAARRPDSVYAAIGLDRDQALCLNSALTDEVDKLRVLVSGSSQIAAIGEIGLDFHYHPESRTEQIALFRAQLEMACELGLPVIVHSRDAEAETLAELSRHSRAWPHAGRAAGVLHCFTGSREFAEALVKDGYFISFSGIITFRNAAELRNVAGVVPESALVVETDTPYLGPEPVRGKANEPANIRYVVETIARCRGVAVEQLADTLFKNGERLFRRQPSGAL
jgi:TatD DNase family protein